jgi:hypothetical protein
MFKLTAVPQVMANYLKYVNFPWPILEALLSFFNARFYVKNNILRQNYLNQRKLPTIPNHKFSKSAYHEKINLVVQKIT